MIRIRYLGTGAAEGFPAPFCECAACERVRRLGGKNRKTRSCALINEHILIDLSPDIFMQSWENSLHLSAVDTIVFTHSHDDHLDLMSLMLRCKDGATVLPKIKRDENYISIWCNDAVREKINKKFSEEKHADPSKLHFSKIAYGVPFSVGDIEFTAFEADHIKGEECCIFALSDGTHSFLYGNDTGLPPERTFDALNRYGKVFAAISLDCARGTLPGDAHMGLAEDKTVCERLRSCGLIDGATKIYLNHFSHMCGLAPDEFASLAEKDDMYLTHDGMVVTV
ncbi:hypothetical protein IZU27_02785 [Treponema socranskii]|uniref:MBL fold metallo-hydrolase n=1 Tax=Treponema TaxID=157 RepID=UPI0016523070|nr:MBL fold metallo-hydrolase [Treponema sp. Marseille-Q4130]MBC6720362.1 hypothetical protein [Treponema sp. Marseille-Q4130]